jgi:tetratricopeptide (TPR) repeat protein
MMRARALDPLSLITDVLVGTSFGFMGETEHEIRELKKVIDLDSGFASAHYYLGRVYMGQRRYDEALAEFTVAKELFNNAPIVSAELASAYAFSGKKKEAQAVLDELNQRAKKEYVSPCLLAQVYAALGEKEQVMTSLEKAYSEHAFGLMFVASYLNRDDLRSDPRLQRIIKGIGFPALATSSSRLSAASYSNR